jgi:predicted DNA-binding transcriptional regulator YafY
VKALRRHGSNDQSFSTTARALRLQILLACARQPGGFHLSRAFARSLGLRRRKLRAEITHWRQDGAPFVLIGNRLLIASGNATRLVFDLTVDELTTLIGALRRIKDAAHVASDLTDAANLLHRIAVQLSVEQFHKFAALGQFSQMPQPLTPDKRPTTETHNLIVHAITARQKLRILYTDAGGARTVRTVWPVTLTFHGAVLAAWCEMRQAFRHFNLYKITAPELLVDRIPETRATLLTRLRAEMPDAG